MTTGMNWLFLTHWHSNALCVMIVRLCDMIHLPISMPMNEQQIDDALRLWLTSHFEHHCGQFIIVRDSAEYSYIVNGCNDSIGNSMWSSSQVIIEIIRSIFIYYWCKIVSTQIKTQTSSNLALKLQGDTLWVLLWRRIATASCSDWELRLNED